MWDNLPNMPTGAYQRKIDKTKYTHVCLKCGTTFFDNHCRNVNPRKYCSAVCYQSVKDITGQKFGSLTAIKFVKNDKWRSSFWLFKCKCGKETIASKGSVISGGTYSCGCQRSFGKIKHGMQTTRFYNIWSGMNARCLSCKGYSDRGIKCLWKSFEDFRDDMYGSYVIHISIHGEKNTSIDRINNDDSYYRDNCRWATAKEQALNRRSNRLITLNNVLQLQS